MLYFLFMLFCLAGCEEEDKDILQTVPTNPAGEVDHSDCIPEEECCMVCQTDSSQACGDACINLEYNCSSEEGCACDEEDVCSSEE